MPCVRSRARTGGPGASPFAPRTLLLLLTAGGLAFLLLLWALGSGLAGGSTNNGGGHAGGTGLNGFAAFSQLLERQGIDVSRARSPALLDDPGLLVLTPPAQADGEEIARIVERRRHVGPTMVIAPKWIASGASAQQEGARQGWVALAGTALPQWRGFYDDVAVSIGKAPWRDGSNWAAAGVRGRLPDAERVESGAGDRLVPLVVTADERILAAYYQDDGYYPELAGIAPPGAPSGEEEDLYPVILVFEPDLLDNWGMARRENAQLAALLVDSALEYSPRRVTFDLTLNGLGRSANLLTLAFTPPYLAATLCLILAAIAAAWRAFLRFGPALVPNRPIAFGKHALVSSAANLIRRTRRFHLVTRPYVDRTRARIAQALGLPQSASAEAGERAIDQAIARRHPGTEPFSRLAASLRAARKPPAILRAAQALHALERTIRR
jgi:hypothetical protein